MILQALGETLTESGFVVDCRTACRLPCNNSLLVKLPYRKIAIIKCIDWFHLQFFQLAPSDGLTGRRGLDSYRFDVGDPDSIDKMVEALREHA